MKKIIIILFSLLFIYNPGYCRADETFSGEQIKEDLTFLVRNMEKYNPGLHVFNPNFNKEKDSLIKSVKRGMPLLEFHGMVCRLVALSNEGHFDVGSGEDKVYRGFKENLYTYLPLGLSFIDGRAFVWGNFTENEQPGKGDEIITINGKSIGEIIRELFLYIQTDGYIETRKYNVLNSSFAVYYYLFIEQPGTFNISYRESKSNDKIDISIPASSREQILANYERNYKRKTSASEKKTTPGRPGINEFYELQFQDKTATLKLKSFYWKLVKKYKIKASSFYKGIFKGLKEKGTRNLIIDLRNNYGGRKEFCSGMLPYIMKQPVAGIYETSVSRSGKKKEYKLPKKSKLAFNGDIYVLVNGKTFSAAATLARFLKEYGDAVIIGEEAAGRYEGYVAGSKKAVYLPHSNLRILIPLYLHRYPPSKKQTTRNRGILPDYEISYTFNELIGKKDKELEFTLRLISEKAVH